MPGKLPVRFSGKYMDVYEYLCLTFSTTDNYIDHQLKLSLIFIFTNNAELGTRKKIIPPLNPGAENKQKFGIFLPESFRWFIFCRVQKTCIRQCKISCL